MVVPVGEGQVIGLDLLGDQTGRSLYFPDAVPQISTDGVYVGSKLRGGRPGLNSAVSVNAQYNMFGGMGTSENSNTQVRPISAARGA